MVLSGLPIINNKHLDPNLYPDVSRRIKKKKCFMLKCNQPVREVDDINFYLCDEHLPRKYFNGKLLDNELEREINTIMIKQQNLRNHIDQIDNNFETLTRKEYTKEQDKTFQNKMKQLFQIQKNIDHYFYNRYYKTIIDKDPNDKGFRKVKIHNQFIMDYSTNTITLKYSFENSPTIETFTTELIPPFLTDGFLELREDIQMANLEHFTQFIVFGLLRIYYNKKGILQVYKLHNNELDLDHIVYETADKIIYINLLSEDEFRADLLKQFEFKMYPGDEFPPPTEKLKKHKKFLARKHHPDRPNGCDEKMKDINRLCDLLTDKGEFRSEFEQKPKIDVYVYNKTEDFGYFENIDNKIKTEIKPFTDFKNIPIQDVDVFYLPRIRSLLSDEIKIYNTDNEKKKTNLENDLITIKNKYILTEYLVGSHHKSKSRYKIYKKKNKETCSKVMFKDSSYRTKYNKGFLKAAIEYVKSKSCKRKNNTFNNNLFCVHQNVYRPFRYEEPNEDLPEFHVHDHDHDHDPLPDMYDRSFPCVNEILRQIDAPKEEFCGLIYYYYPNNLFDGEYCYNKDSYSPEEFYNYYIFSTNQQVVRMQLYWWWYYVPEDIREDIIKLIEVQKPELYFLLLGNYIFKDDQVKQYFYKFFDELEDFTLGLGNQFGITSFH